ncbi:MAG: transglutaminase domain-containing protein [Spirochaetes bacterium]|nr:transglutaminase domain-containing protein [Spirochaetota bacterium]
MYAVRLGGMLLCLFAGWSPVYPYTWFVEGSREFVYSRTGGSGMETSNALNSQERWGVWNGRTVMVNRVDFRRPSAPDLRRPADEEELLALENTEAPDEEALRSLVRSMTGEAATTDEAAARLAIWVRENITVAQTAPPGPMEMIDVKRATPAGFGTLLTELFRAAGIPARTLSTYVPRGCGCNYGSTGGHSSLAEFFSPGRGWLFCDPQNSFGYAEPFNLLDWGYCDGDFGDEIARIDESYVVNMKGEPVRWQVFSAPAWGRPQRPAFVFRVVDQDGKSGVSSPGLFLGLKQALEMMRSPASRTDGGAEEKGWSGVVTDYKGFSAEFCGGYVKVKTSRDATHVSLLPLDRGMGGRWFRDRAAVIMGNCLFAREYTFTGSGTYLFNADFSDRAVVKRILLRRENGAPLGSERVTIRLAGEEYEIRSDREGEICIIADAQDMALALRGREHHVSFSSGPVQRVPRYQLPQYDIVERYIGERRMGGGTVVCELRDLSNHPSRYSFDSLLLYGRNRRARRLEAEEPGVVSAQGLNPGEQYTLLFQLGERSIKRTFTACEGEAVRMRVSAVEQYLNLSIVTPPGMRVPVIYEYLPAGDVVPYRTRNNTLMISAPPGEHVFADNKAGRGFVPLRITADAVRWDYGSADCDPEYQYHVMELLHRGINFAAGYVMHGGDRVRAAEIWLQDLQRGSMVRGDTGDDGYFMFSDIRVGVPYRVLLLGRDYCVSGFFTGRSGKNRVQLDTSRLSATRIITGSNPVKGAGGLHRNVGDSKDIFLLLPYWDRGIRINSRKLSCTMECYTVYLDRGSLMFSSSGSIADAVPVKATGSRIEIPLLAAGGDSLAERYHALRDTVPKHVPCLIARVRDRGGSVITGGRIRLLSETDTRSLQPDESGIIEADNLIPGREYTLLYNGDGYQVAHAFTLNVGGLHRMDLAAQKLPAVSLKLSNYDGSLFRTFPSKSVDGISFSSEQCEPKNGRYTVYGDGGPVYFRIGRRRALRGFASGEHLVDCRVNPAPPLEEYGRIAEALFREESVLIFTISRDGIPLRDYSVKACIGEEERTLYDSEGVMLLRGEGGSAGIFYNSRGAYLDCLLPLREGAVTVKRIDLAADSRIHLSLSRGKSAVTGGEVRIYRDVVLKEGKIAEYGSVARAVTDNRGLCQITVPDGTYYLDYGNGSPVRVVVGGARKILRFSL